MADLYVQYGCGLSAPAGWLNFDSSPTLRLQRIPVLGRLNFGDTIRFPAEVRYGDIIRGLPLDDGSCAGIYASHVLEHLAFEDADKALANTYRYLREGGIFRLVVPDLHRLASTYLASDSPDSAHQFMQDSGLGRKRRSRRLVPLVKEALRSGHLWLWDEKSMSRALEDHGFTSIRRCQFNDAADPNFAAVESRQRFEEGFALECRK